jgi:hypothetical protein
MAISPAVSRAASEAAMTNRDSVHVHGDSKIIFVLIADRKKFDDIPLTALEHDNRAEGRGHVLSKSMDGKDNGGSENTVMMVFQHWLEDSDISRLLASPKKGD